MAKVNNRKKYLKIAKTVIDKFDLDEENYTLINPSLYSYKNVIIKNNHNNKVYTKDKNLVAKLNIDFFNAKNCTVYLGKTLRGNIHIKVHFDESILYIGDDCDFKKIIIDLNQRNDFIAIGNNVATNINNQWRSGLRAGNGNPGIIVGDDCMFAADIVMRNTDAHPIYDIDTEEHINQPKSLILIEPHVWVGQQVNILKDTKIGACSIVALGSIVVKDIERFSLAKGVPAIGKVNKELYWSLSEEDEFRKRAKFYMDKYSTAE